MKLKNKLQSFNNFTYKEEKNLIKNGINGEKR